MDRDVLRSLPKVLLHDHLDGGLRPRSIAELAAEVSYDGLPTSDPDDLSRWFYQGAAGSLERYLEAFRHTIGVMQSPEALERVAAESIEDLASEGVVYAEIRFAPSLHLRRGLTREEVIGAVLRGVDRGRASTGVEAGVIVDAMRQEHDSEQVVAAALAFRDRGVVAFDLAGPEAGYPPTEHLAACRTARNGGLHLTIHAGEGDGVESIGGAVGACGAERIGHGVRIAEDLEIVEGRVVGLGPVARRVLTSSIPLELCPTSNVHTGVVPSMREHPIGLLYRSGFAVTLNTDNRLMSAITLTDELASMVEVHGFEMEDLRRITLRAVDAAFCDEAVRARVRRRVEEGYPA